MTKEIASLSEFESMGKANAEEGYDQRSEYENAFQSYWQNVSDTAYEMGAKHCDKSYNAASEAFKLRWSELDV